MTLTALLLKPYSRRRFIMIAAALAGMLTTAYILFLPQQIARARQSNRTVSGLVVTQRESAYFDVTSFEADNSREDRATTSSFGLGADSNVGPDEKLATLGGSTTVADDSLSDHNRSIPVLISSFAAGSVGSVVPSLTDHVVPNTKNNVPSFGFEEATREVEENLPVGTKVGKPVTANDEDLTHMIRYSLVGEDASCFEIDAHSGQITTSGVMDFEVASKFVVGVKADDGNAGINRATIAIHVVNVDEEGVVMLIPDRPDVGWPVSASLSDPDGVEGEIRWQWAKSESWGGRYEPIDVADTDSYTPTLDEMGMYLIVQAFYADGQGSGKQVEEMSRETVELDPNAPDACSVHDDRDHIGTSLIVGAGEAIESDFCSAADADWIGMEMEAGQAYAIAIHWLDDVDRDWATPYIAGVNDSVGELITGIHSYGGNRNSVVHALGEITFRALKSGTYYLEVKPSPCCDYALMPVPGAYGVEVHGADVSPDDVPKFEPLMLEFNHRGIKEVTFDGSIETFGDRDTFYFSGDVGNVHAITITSGSGIFNCIHGIARLRTASESMPDTEECSDRPYWKVSRLVTTRDEDGYLTTVGSDDATGDYTLQVRDNAAMPTTMYDGPMPRSDIASDPGTEGLLYVNDSWANGTAVIGEIELALDTDWYEIELYASRRYQIDVHGASSDAGTIVDTDLWIFDADGNHIEGTFDSDSGSHLEARLMYGPPVSGTYFIQVGAGSYETW